MTQLMKLWREADAREPLVQEVIRLGRLLGRAEDSESEAVLAKYEEATLVAARKLAEWKP